VTVAPLEDIRLEQGEADALTRAVGQVLRAARLARGWHLNEASRRAGLSQSQLCRLELGARQINMCRLMELCAALGIRPSTVVDAAERDAFPFGWPDDAGVPGA
jgi:transcriptional regulator with XRE-family HTH domain